MSSNGIAARLVEALASLKLAVAVMLLLGAASAWATFYEVSHGTAAVQRDFYGAPWFTVLLVLLFVNILASLLMRYPWTRHHAGFVLAHVGILAILAGSLVTLRVGIDGSMALYEGESSDRVRLRDQALQVVLGDGTHVTLPFSMPREARSSEQRLAVPERDVVLVVQETQPHVTVSEDLVEGTRPNPAIHFRLVAPMGEQHGWMVASDPRQNHLHLGAAALALQAAATPAEAEGLVQRTEPGHLSFVSVAGEPELTWATRTSAGVLERGKVAVGGTVPTPFGMQVRVERFLPTAESRRVVRPAGQVPRKEEERQPAVRVRLEASGQRSEPTWLLWGDSSPIAAGPVAGTVAFQSPEVSLPFRVTLLDFNSDTYPGSRMAATYESRVRVEDPERGTAEYLISMNNPLHYRGYIFFQSSYVEGTPMMSIFSVSRSPGLPIVYLGTALVGIGILWMFYLKPALARRQGRRALEERRRREAEGVAGMAEAHGRA